MLLFLFKKKSIIMKKYFYTNISLILQFLFFPLLITAQSEKVKTSSESETCIDCHMYIHPGIISSWEASLHSKTTPAIGMNKKKLEKRISADSLPENLNNVVVGCYECHSLNTNQHADSFEHNGYNINVIVSSADCATCHPVEQEQYANNLMAHAYGNLMNNTVYKDLRESINGNYHYQKNEITVTAANAKTEEESCLYCHGTKTEVTGIETRETDFGELEFPIIEGWPNQGVGRINPDGSKGSCTSCHPRHSFSIETARKPHTCAECHKGPDVPAYKVYEVSKHGNIYSSKKDEYNFNNVPWVLGEDFEVPTCAACHTSLIVDAEGSKIADRTHQFNDRLSWRLFGVPYAHPHPISPETDKIVNQAGLQLPAELTGEYVSEFLISEEEQEKRNAEMQNICNNCHATSWTNAHFARLKNTIETTNQSTLAATQILLKAWELELAKGLDQNSSIFDEKIERNWTSTWLFYANSVRFTSAMGGGGDYGVFANGRYQLSEKIIEMQEWIELHKKIYKKK